MTIKDFGVNTSTLKIVAAFASCPGELAALDIDNI
jgi:hypothetical protein